MRATGEHHDAKASMYELWTGDNVRQGRSGVPRTDAVLSTLWRRVPAPRRVVGTARRPLFIGLELAAEGGEVGDADQPDGGSDAEGQFGAGL